MNRYLIDTNIIIYTLRGVSSVVEFMAHIYGNDQAEIVYSTITEAEIFSRALEDEIKLMTEELLSAGDIMEVSSAIAGRAGKIRAKCHAKGCKIKLPDALIAATALLENAVLVTHNIRDFSKITEVEERLVIIDPIKGLK